jgi:hypothetical protein
MARMRPGVVKAGCVFMALLIENRGDEAGHYAAVLAGHHLRDRVL